MNLLQIHEPGSTPDPHAEEAELAIGIDLGTTNTVAAIATENGPEVLRAADGSALLPSVVHYRADGSVEVGAGGAGCWHQRSRRRHCLDQAPDGPRARRMCGAWPAICPSRSCRARAWCASRSAIGC